MTTANPSRGARAGLADRTGTAVEAAGKNEGATLVDLIGRMDRQVERALPSHLQANAGAYTRALVTVVKQTPALLRAQPETVLGGLMLASQLGLQFGPLGHCYLVPYKGKAQFILGYKGVIDLAWRSGRLASIAAKTVREGDFFEFEYGLADRLEHRPDLDSEREGRSIRWYAVAKFTDGGHAFNVLGKAAVDRHRSRSMAKDNGPWVSDYDAMAMKSAVLELKPFLPLTTEVANDMAMDGTVARGAVGDDEVEIDYIDVDAVEADENGEVLDPGARIREPLPEDPQGTILNGSPR